MNTTTIVVTLSGSRSGLTDDNFVVEKSTDGGTTWEANDDTGLVDGGSTYTLTIPDIANGDKVRVTGNFAITGSAAATASFIPDNTYTIDSAGNTATTLKDGTRGVRAKGTDFTGTFAESIAALIDAGKLIEGDKITIASNVITKIELLRSAAATNLTALQATTAVTGGLTVGASIVNTKANAILFKAKFVSGSGTTTLKYQISGFFVPDNIGSTTLTGDAPLGIISAYAGDVDGKLQLTVADTPAISNQVATFAGAPLVDVTGLFNIPTGATITATADTTATYAPNN